VLNNKIVFKKTWCLGTT